MTVDVEVGGRRRRVVARRCGTGWLVEIDGRQVSVDLAATDRRWSLLLALPEDVGGAERGADDGAWRGAGAIGRPGRSVEVALESRANGQRVVHVNGRPVPMSIAGPRTLFGRRGRDASSTAGVSGRIAAPMPGRVIKVLVHQGEAVAAGQPLLVVEAMKMENEVRAPKAGTIVDLRVSEGMSVEANTILMQVE